MTKPLHSPSPDRSDAAKAALARRRAYHAQLLNALTEVTATLVAEVMGGGVDTRGQRIKTLDGRLAAVPGTLVIITRWAQENKPGED